MVGITKDVLFIILLVIIIVLIILIMLVKNKSIKSLNTSTIITKYVNTPISSSDCSGSNPPTPPNSLSIIPTLQQLESNMFSSVIQYLNMYMIMLFVYLYQSNMIPLSSDVVSVINDNIDIYLMQYLKAVAAFTYTCPSIQCSYGGAIFD